MSTSRIKGITLEIGGDTTGLDKALNGVNKEAGEIQKNLKDVDRLLKLDPTNTELLKQKYELLNRAVENSEEKLKSLKNAEQQVQKQFKEGKISEDQYNALKREIIATEQNLKDLKEKAVQAEKALNGVDEKPIEEVGQAANKAEKELKEAGKEASNFGDYLKANAITEGAKSIISSFKDMAEETKEYSKIMGTLKTSSEDAGYSAEETAETFKHLYGVLGDDQTAATTTANLQAMELEQEKVTKMTTAAVGAWAKYGDSIPIDGLAEALNETSKVGTVTGTFADVLNWAGISEDKFNEKLAACANETERANLILEQLTNQGLVDAGNAWMENNKAIVENNEAQADLQEQMAELGEKVTPIITKITDAVAKLLEGFNNLDGTTQTVILTVIALTAAMGPLSTAIGGISSTISFLVSNPIVLLIAAIVGLVALIATKGDEMQDILQKVDDFLQKIFVIDWSESFGAAGEILNAFFANVKNYWDAIKRIFSGIIDFIRGVFTGDWERAWNGVVNIFGGIWDGLVAIVKRPINLIIGFINAMIDGVEGAINWMIKGLNIMSFEVPDWVPLIGGEKFGFDLEKVDFGNIPYLAKGGVLSSGSAVVGEAGPELLTMQGNQAIVQPLTNQTTTNTSYLGGVNIQVYGAPGQNVEELAEIVSQKISEATDRRGAAYA